MTRFLAVQHTFSEFFGALEPQWEMRDIAFNYVRTVAGQDVAGPPSQFDALWLLGAAWPIADAARCPWVEDEIRLLRAFQKSGRPVIGLGGGAHVLAAAHGSRVFAEPAQAAYFTTAHGVVTDDPLAQAVDGRRVLVMVNGRAALDASLTPVAIDDAGRWIAFRTPSPGYGLLFRPELKPGMLEDMVMEADREMPEDIGTLIETAREEWGALQATTERVTVALVSALDLMRERRKSPLFHLTVQR